MKEKEAKREENGKNLLITEIKALAKTYSDNLKIKIYECKEEMKQDDTSHHLIYRVLGISSKDGQLIDEYQNTGRFLYNYAGSFLEKAASLCLEFNNPEGKKQPLRTIKGKDLKHLKLIFSMAIMLLKLNGEMLLLMVTILQKNIHE